VQSGGGNALGLPIGSESDGADALQQPEVSPKSSGRILGGARGVGHQAVVDLTSRPMAVNQSQDVDEPKAIRE
jgi:hypothetical protein